MDRYSHRREKFGGSNPSFSSSLLDSIYRSIDEGDEELELYKETMKMKNQQMNGEDQEIDNFRNICMIEKWMMEKKESQKVIIRRRSSADFSIKARDRDQYRGGGDSFFSNSSSSCSDNSSIYGGFSSSEAEYIATKNRVYSDNGVSLNSYRAHKPKPIRTNGDDFQNPKLEKGFAKTKSKALKIYSDLKKAKNQPISPGGKLATFLNSIFTSGNSKKPKIFTSSHDANSERESKSANTSTCSSASSFSRSCLSKTPSKLTNNNNMIKRSVKFIDDDQHYQPFMEASKESINSSIMEKNRRVEEAARDLLRNYQKRVELEYDLKSKNHAKNEIFDNYDDEEEFEDDDDLFELDNLSAIGDIERYREELPVYETTHLHTNRAIANGMIL